ncbi:MAG: UbiA family prenyltransferase [Lewinellaceae bacterium]|nr:UbiA family prenyltransferase [Lewinellaceae bacterium]HRW76677.1 UbiA-like polyprenyltransferase [Saprospiraceae bacterium]
MTAVAPSVRHFLSLVKFSHTLFALPFAAIGFSLGFLTERPDSLFWIGVKVLLCMVLARNTAMAFNRLIDADIDRRNPRTAVREIPAGVLSMRQVTWFVVINSVLFILTTATINLLCFALSPVALFVIMGYSYTKRITPLCHVILGLGLALAPIGAFMAVTGTIISEVILLGVAVLSWVGGFDIIYAMQDESFDQENQLYSIPSWLGGKKALRVSRLLHVVSFLSLASSLWLVQDHFQANITLLILALFIFSSLLFYQHRLVSPDDLRKVNLAFFTTNGIASVCFGILTILSLFL